MLMLRELNWNTLELNSLHLRLKYLIRESSQHHQVKDNKTALQPRESTTTLNLQSKAPDSLRLHSDP